MKGREHKTLLHRLALWALDRPEDKAHYFKSSDDQWKSITTKSFWEQVSRIAFTLQKNGVNRGDVVAIYASNAPEWIQWELGAVLAGAISVGIHPQLHPSDLKHVLMQTKPKIIITEADAFRARVNDLNLSETTVLLFNETLSWLSKDALGDFAAQALAALDENQTSFLIYTSGTTAFPKGVMLGLKQFTRVADMISREWNMPFMEGALFSFLPLAHVAEKIQSIALALTNRYPVWFNSSFHHFAAELKDVRPTMLLAVPRIWERMKEQVEAKRPKLNSRLKVAEKIDSVIEELYLSQVKSQLGLDRLKIAVSGAAKLSPSIGHWYQRIGIEIAEIYGMSESCGLITMGERDSKGSCESDFTTVGKVPHGLEVKIEKNGEIWVKGESLFQGYFQDLEETHAVSVDGWLKTGDLGEWNEKQELKIIGRDREIIKLANGRMIAPVPIENALKELTEVSNACVFGDGSTSLMAFITLKEKVLMEYKFIPGAIEGLSVEAEDLKNKLREGIDELVKLGKIKEKIPNFVIISRDFLQDEKEITATQKLNRTRIKENFNYFFSNE